jgi:hypothetical protein
MISRQVFTKPTASRGLKPAVTRGELELAGMFFHQLLEMPERRNLAEVRVHSVRPGLGAENLCGFIN